MANMSRGLVFIFVRDFLFCVELFFSEMISFREEKKRKHFALRNLAAICGEFCVSLLFSFIVFEISEMTNYDRIVSVFTGIFSYSLMFGMQIGVLLFIYKVDFNKLLSLMAFSFVFRQVVFSLYVALFTWANMNLLFFKYDSFNWMTFMVYLGFHSFAYVVFLSFSLLRKDNTPPQSEKSVLIILFSAIFANMVVCTIGEVYSTDDNDFMYVILLFSNIISLLLLTSIEWIMRKMYSLRNENQVTSQLLREKESQFKFAKANMERLHILAHDLKHQSQALRAGGEEAKEILDNLDDAVTNYDAILLTENPTINVILNEKWLYCQKHSIRLSTIVDPKALSQLETIELYSLFGNLLDNSIEAVMKIKDKDKRTISLNVTYGKGLSSIDIRNYYVGEIKIEDDENVTSKKDSFAHGFGTKSIKGIVEKYNGDYSRETDKDIYIVKIVIPDIR